MKLDKFVVNKFSEKTSSHIYEVVIPEGSRFLKMTILHDGIYAWYEVPEIQTSDTRIDKYTFISPDNSIPQNSEFVTILDTAINSPSGQGILIFPIYKLKE